MCDVMAFVMNRSWCIALNSWATNDRACSPRSTVSNVVFG